MLPLFRATNAPTMSTSRRLNDSMRTAQLIEVCVEQLAGIGYVFGGEHEEPMTVDWTIGERSFMEAFRSLPDAGQERA